MDPLVELSVLREATRLRLTKAAILNLRYLAECYAAGDKHDLRIATGLTLLLDMHDRLETIPRG